jgi:hypothetical protein
LLDRDTFGITAWPNQDPIAGIRLSKGLADRLELSASHRVDHESGRLGFLGCSADDLAHSTDQLRVLQNGDGVVVSVAVACAQLGLLLVETNQLDRLAASMSATRGKTWDGGTPSRGAKCLCELPQPLSNHGRCVGLEAQLTPIQEIPAADDLGQAVFHSLKSIVERGSRDIVDRMNQVRATQLSLPIQEKLQFIPTGRALEVAGRQDRNQEAVLSPMTHAPVLSSSGPNADRCGRRAG